MSAVKSIFFSIGLVITYHISSLWTKFRCFPILHHSCSLVSQETVASSDETFTLLRTSSGRQFSLEKPIIVHEYTSRWSPIIV